MLTETLKTVIDSKHLDLLANYHVDKNPEKYRQSYADYSTELLLASLLTYYRDISSLKPIDNDEGSIIFRHTFKGISRKEYRIIEPVIEELNHLCNFATSHIMFMHSNPFYDRDPNYGPLSSKEYFQAFMEKTIEDTVDTSYYMARKFDIEPDKSITRSAKDSRAAYILEILKRGDVIIDTIQRHLFHQFPSFFLIGGEWKNVYNQIKSTLEPASIH